MWDLIKKWGILSAVFLLPWQTRYIWSSAEIGGHASEFAVYSVYAVQVLIVLVAFVFIVDALRQKKKIVTAEAMRHAPVGGAVVVLFLILFSQIFGLNETYGWFHFSFIITAMVLYWLLIKAKISKQELIFAFAFGLLLPIIFGVYQVIVGSFPASTIFGIATRDVARPGDSVFILSNGHRLLRAYGTFSHPNIFAGYLVIGILSLIAFLKRTPKDSIILVLIGLMIISLVLTGSSTAFLALICSILFILVATKFAPAWKKKIPWVSGLLAFLIVVAGISGPFFASTFSFAGPSVFERIDFIEYWFEVIIDIGFSGYGPGQYIFAFAHLFPGLDWWQYQPVHNTFLLVYAELGFWFTAVFFTWIQFLWRKLSTAPFSKYVLSVTGMLLALMILASFDHYLWSSWSGLALCAYVLALTTKSE